MVALLTPNAKQQFFDNDGSPAAGFKLHTYAAGTTTPQSTFTDRAGLVPNSNPITLDARGEAVLYLTPGLVYDYVLRKPDTSLVWTRPGVSAEAEDSVLRADLSSSTGGSNVGVAQTGTGAIAEEILSEYRRTVRPEQFGATGNGVTDDSPGFQLALNRAAGGVLKLTPGKVYKVNTPVKVKSNTIIDARGATIIRGAAIDNVIRNDADGVTGGYAANSNIFLLGGTWDGNSGTFGATPCTIIAFGHCSNVRIKDAVISHTNTYHHIEVNGCFNVEIEGCTLSGGASLALTTNEAIQIDLNIDGSQFPWFGPQDSTVCTNINIHDNLFIDVGTGVGSHSASGSLRHGNILINNNSFSGCSYAGITALNWTDMKIRGNRFERGYYGIIHTSSGTATLRNNIIADNTFFDVGNTAHVGTSARAIFVQQASDNSHQITGLSIEGNSIIDMVTVGKSTIAISVNYCQTIKVSDNIIRNIQQGGIMLFQVSRAVVTNNLVESANTSSTGSQYGIGLAGTCVRAVIDGNMTNTMGIFNTDRAVVQNNNITTAASLFSGSNTSTTIARNLTDTTFA